MTLRRALATLAALSLLTPAPALAKPAAPKPAPRAAAPAADPVDFGRMAISAGAQLVGGRGLTGSVDFRANLGLAEMSAVLKAPPGSPLSFFTAGADVAFIGHTGRFLPIDVQTVVGIGASTLMLDVPATRGTGTTTDISAYLYMPVGLRYALGVGGIGIEAQALYHLPAVYFWKGASDPTHWHFGADAHLGTLLAGAFYETGAVYNGPGARVGLTF